jgi:hypothetical protein
MGGGDRSRLPYERRGVRHKSGCPSGDFGPCDCDKVIKYAQAVISQTTDGKWKLTVQSDRQVEAMLVGALEDIVKELKHVATRDWEKRS